MNAPQGRSIQRQVRLPIGKAVEIAWKSIRLRLSRSLVVTSSIALAIAFLVSILCGEAIVDSMRQWKEGFESSPRAVELLADRQRLEGQTNEHEAELRRALRDATAAGKDAPVVDFRKLLGRDLSDLREELGGLPRHRANCRHGCPATKRPSRRWFAGWNRRGCSSASGTSWPHRRRWRCG